MYKFGQTELQVISDRESGHWHLGLDLKLSEYLDSQAVGDLIEEYLLAYLAGADLGDYHIKSNISTFNKSDLAALISTFKTDLLATTQTLGSNSILVKLENPQLKLSFQIPLSLEVLYGKQDKKDLEEELWQQLLAPELSLPQVVYPCLENLLPYQDSLYVYEEAVYDTLFSASQFLVVNDGQLSLVNSPQHPLETFYNYLQLPQAFNRKLRINLKYNMYGKRNESIQLDYRKLFGVLSSGMKTAVFISPPEGENSQVMLVFFDSLTGVRHILYGSIDPKVFVSGVEKTFNLQLICYIIGSADKMQYNPGKEPPWQVKIK